MKILVCGSRTFTDVALVRRKMEPLPKDTIIVHGVCPDGGADLIADTVARNLGLEVRPYPPDTRLYGPWPACGPRRNLAMYEGESPDRCWAFLNAGEPVKGTASAVDLALRRGVVARLWYSARGGCAR